MARGHWLLLLPPEMLPNIKCKSFRMLTYFEHGENNMRPHVRIPFIDFMSNGGKGSKTFNLITERTLSASFLISSLSYLLFVFHLIRHIFLHSVFIKFVQSCFQNIVFPNTVHQVYTTITL